MNKNNRTYNKHPFYFKHANFVIISISIISLSCFQNSEKTFFQTIKNSRLLPDTTSLLVYNVENVFDMINNGSEYSQYKPGKNNWTHETCSQKLNNIASVISAINADIAVLCEVENKHAGLLLKKRLKKSGCSYNYIATGNSPNPASVCQVILSKHPIVFSQGHGVPSKGTHHTRNLLEADIAIGQDTLKIFALHWPSKRNKESTRIAASKILTRRIQALPKDCDYIITGDFNSNYNEAETFFTAQLDDTKGITAINHILNTVKSHPGKPLSFFTKKEVQKQYRKNTHYNPWLELPGHKRFSYIFRGQRNTLDHILLPSPLFDSTGISYVDNSFSLFTWFGRLLYNGVPFRWQMDYKKNGPIHKGKGYSDHLPITAKFTTHPFTFADSDNQKLLPENIKQLEYRKGDFETGVEGWIPGSNNYHLICDNTNAALGHYSLKIEGKSTKSGRAANIRLPLNNDTIKTVPPGKVTFQLKGSGRFAFRVRLDKTSWLCYSKETFKHRIKNTRYTSFNSDTWQNITLDFPIMAEKPDVIEIEIRAAQNEYLKIWIDCFRIE